MHYPPSRILAAALLLGASACSGGAEVGSAPSAAKREVWKPPAPVNVVLILIDTLRADAILDPDGRYDTPNIDRLAAEGVLFPRAFAAAPMTLPSHVSLFSSRPPTETKVLNNGQKIPEALPLLAEWLSKQHYDTRAVVSLGTLNPPTRGKGVSRGFGSYDYDYWCMAQAEGTEARLRASLAERDTAKPLFLFAHFSDPHEPYNAHGTELTEVDLKMDGELLDRLVTSDMSFWSKTVKLSEGRTVFEFSIPDTRPGKFRVRQLECRENGERLEVNWEQYKAMNRVKSAVVSIDRGQRAPAACELRAWINDVPPSDDSRRSRYAQEVAYADRYVGELLRRLDELGLYQDSLIVFTSDHGEALGEPRWNGGTFFGHAKHLTDEQIHVPLIIRLPRNDPRREPLAAAATRVVSHLDLVPTLLEIAGVPPLPGQRGISLFEPHPAVHVAQTQMPEAERNQVALRDERYKMIYFPGGEREADSFVLFDLVEDPGELHDVFGRKGDQRPGWPERLRHLYEHTADDFRAGAADEPADVEMLNALGYGGGDDDEGG